MYYSKTKIVLFLAVAMSFAAPAALAQMGRRWPSEKKVIADPVTGTPLTFLTSTDGGYRQTKIYQTHRQWTADGKWLIFRGTRETGSQAFAVNEETGDIVQVTESGFSGMLCAGNKTMKLFTNDGRAGQTRAGRNRGPRWRTTADSGDRSRPALCRRCRRERETRGKLPACLRNDPLHT